jgi:hypothetical protein
MALARAVTDPVTADVQREQDHKARDDGDVYAVIDRFSPHDSYRVLTAKCGG